MREPTPLAAPNVTDTALIWEGGGMRAAYSSGVLVTLLAHGVHVGWVGGISAGSSCTCNYVTQDADRAPGGRRPLKESAAAQRDFPGALEDALLLGHR